MNEAEFLELKKKLTDEFNRNLDALRRVWRIEHPSQPPPSSPDDSALPKARLPRGDVTNAVLQALSDARGDFTWRDVRSWLADRQPDLAANRTTVSQILKKLAQSAVIVEVEVGRGKRPSRYVKSEQANSNANGEPRLSTFDQAAELRKLAGQLGYTVQRLREEYIGSYEKIVHMPFDVVERILVELRDKVSRQSPTPE